MKPLDLLKGAAVMSAMPAPGKVALTGPQRTAGRLQLGADLRRALDASEPWLEGRAATCAVNYALALLATTGAPADPEDVENLRRCDAMIGLPFERVREAFKAGVIVALPTTIGLAAKEFKP